MKLSLSVLCLLMSLNCYSQSDSVRYKLDFGNPVNNNSNPYYNSKGKFTRHSPDSILLYINGKFYHPREMDLWTDQQVKEFDASVESIDVETNREVIDSLVCRRIKTIFIFRLKDDSIK